MIRDASVVGWDSDEVSVVTDACADVERVSDGD